MSRIFTVDVEEYYDAENVATSLKKTHHKNLESRVEMEVHKILDLLNQYGSHATFFVLGYVAEKHKSLIREIHQGGHEIASHGYFHIPLHKHTAKSFNEDIDHSSKVLSDITGSPVRGYRATSFSFSSGHPWFFDILAKHHMIYDSSIALSLFRFNHFDLNEMPEKADCFEISKGILEFPVASAHLGPIPLPLGGGYFRAYPYWLTRWGLEHADHRKSHSFTFYIHPWELDPEQPRFHLSPLKQIRHYLNLNNTEKKLEHLLKDMQFCSIRDVLPKAA